MLRGIVQLAWLLSRNLQGLFANAFVLLSGSLNVDVYLTINVEPLYIFQMQRSPADFRAKSIGKLQLL